MRNLASVDHFSVKYGGSASTAAAGIPPSQRSITLFMNAASRDDDRPQGTTHPPWEYAASTMAAPCRHDTSQCCSPRVLQTERQLLAEELRSLPAEALKHDHTFLKGISGGVVAVSIMLSEHQHVVRFLCQDSASISDVAHPLRQLTQRTGVRGDVKVLCSLCCIAPAPADRSQCVSHDNQSYAGMVSTSGGRAKGPLMSSDTKLVYFDPSVPSLRLGENSTSAASTSSTVQPEV